MKQNKFAPGNWQSLKPSLNRVKAFLNSIVPNFKKWVPKQLPWTSPHATPYTYTLDLPGTDKRDISLKVARGRLIVKAETRLSSRRERNGVRILEHAWAEFHRHVALPGDADEKKISARYKEGRLTITVPRKKQRQANDCRVRVNYA